MLDAASQTKNGAACGQSQPQRRTSVELNPANLAVLVSTRVDSKDYDWVALEHRTLTRRLLALCELTQIDAGESEHLGQNGAPSRLANHSTVLDTSLASEVGLLQCLLPLVSGGCLYTADRDALPDGERHCGWLAEAPVEYLSQLDHPPGSTHWTLCPGWLVRWWCCVVRNGPTAQTARRRSGPVTCRPD